MIYIYIYTQESVLPVRAASFWAGERASEFWRRQFCARGKEEEQAPRGGGRRQQHTATMFFSHELLSRRTALGQVWLVAYSRRRLTRRVASGVSVVGTCDAVLAPTAPMALRMSSILMSGIVLLYQRQQHFLLEDFASFIARVKAAVRRTEESRSATLHAAALTAHAAKITIGNDEDDMIDGDRVRGGGGGGGQGQAMMMLRMMDADDGLRGFGLNQREDAMMEMLMEMMKMPGGDDGGTDPLAEGGDMEDFFMVDLGDGKGAGGAGTGVPQRERARRASRAASIGGAGVGSDIDDFMPALPQPGDAQEDELPAVAMMPLDDDNLLALGGNDDNMMLMETTAMPMPDVNIADGIAGADADGGAATGGEGGKTDDGDGAVVVGTGSPHPEADNGDAPAKKRRVRFESNSVSFEHDAALQVSRAHYHTWQTDTSDITCDRCAALAVGRRKKRKRAMMSCFGGRSRDVEQMLCRPSSVLIGEEGMVHRDVWAVMAQPTLQSTNKRMRGGGDGEASSPVTPFGLNADMLEMEMPVPMMMPENEMRMDDAANMYVCTSPALLLPFKTTHTHTHTHTH